MARTDDDMTRAARDAAFYVQHLRASGTRKRRVNRAVDGVAEWLEWCATVDLEANPLDMTDLLGRFSDVKPRWALLEAADWMVWRLERNPGHCVGCAGDDRRSGPAQLDAGLP